MTTDSPIDKCRKGFEEWAKQNGYSHPYGGKGKSPMLVFAEKAWKAAWNSRATPSVGGGGSGLLTSAGQTAESAESNKAGTEPSPTTPNAELVYELKLAIYEGHKAAWPHSNLSERLIESITQHVVAKLAQLGALKEGI